MKFKNEIGFSKPCLLLAVLLMAAVSFVVIADSDESDAWLETRGTVGGVDWNFYGETIELSPSDNPEQGYERGQMAPAETFFWVADYRIGASI
jgi:hypothetical protein